jgi:hypothetical protein
MGKWILTITAALAFWGMLSSVLPRDRAHWMSRLFRGSRRVAARVVHRSRPAPDPFVVLRIQSRLGVLASEIRALEADPFACAKVRRLEALKAAYDDLLDEGCRLAGVAAFQGADRESRRWHEEQELAERGWTW